MNTDVGWWGGWPVLFLISGLIQMERGHAQLLFTLHSLCPLYMKLIWGGGGLFFFLFPPFSLLVQPQKVPYHGRMSGHTLPAGLAMLDSPLIDFALPLGKHKLALPISSNSSLKGIINHARCPSIAHSEWCLCGEVSGREMRCLKGRGGSPWPCRFPSEPDQVRSWPARRSS